MADGNKELEDLKADLAAANKSIDALTAKNRELLDEKRSTKSGAERQLAEAQDKIMDLEGQIAKLGADHKKALDTAAVNLKTAQDLATTKSTTLSKLIRDEGLTRELVAVGVKKEFIGPVTAFLRDRIQVDEEKAEAFAMVKDAAGKEARKTLAEYAKEWAVSEEGKTFVGVPPSSGGGSQGPGSAAPAGKAMKLADFNALDPASQMDFVTTQRGQVLPD
jgi:chromosome segregation ATPase